MRIVRRLRNSSLVTDASTYLIARLANSAIPFLLLPILTRYLEPSEYGKIAIFQVWVSLIGALCGLGTHGAAGRKYYDYEEPDSQIGEFITACLLLLVASTIVVSFLVAPLSGWVAEFTGLAPSWLFIGIGCAFCNFLIQLRLGQWQVRKQPRRFGAFQISRSLLDMALSLFLVVVLTLGVTGRLGAYAATLFIFGSTAALLLCRDGLVKKTWRPDLMREAAEFGVPLIPHMLGAFLLLTIDRAVVSAQLGIDAAGYYMVAIQLSMALNLVLESINKAYVPWLFERLKRDVPKEKESIVKATYCYYVFVMACATAAFMFGRDVLVWVAGAKYAPSGDVIAWLVLAQALRGMYYMVTNYIFYSKNTGVIARITISAGLLNLFLLFFLTNVFGLIGAAWAMCISMMFQWLVTWWSANRLVPMPWLRSWRHS